VSDYGGIEGYVPGADPSKRVEGVEELGPQECAVVLHHREADALLSMLEQANNAGITPGPGLHVEAAQEAGFRIVSERFRDRDPYNRSTRVVGVVFSSPCGNCAEAGGYDETCPTHGVDGRKWTRDEAIAWMENCRDVHQAWVDLYAACAAQSDPWVCSREKALDGEPAEPLTHEGGGLKDCPTCMRLAATAGASEHHERCVADYDAIIAVLRAAPPTAREQSR